MRGGETSGGVAQLGERGFRSAEGGGSSPPASTSGEWSSGRTFGPGLGGYLSSSSLAAQVIYTGLIRCYNRRVMMCGGHRWSSDVPRT